MLVCCSLSSPSSLRIETVAQAVAGQIETENRERDRQTGKDRDVRGGEDVALGVAQHAAPLWRRLLGSHAEKPERRDEQDRVSETNRRLDHERREDVRQDVPDHNVK